MDEWEEYLANQRAKARELYQDTITYTFTVPRHELTPCEWALYRYLLRHSPATFKQVCDALPDYFTYLTGENCQKNHCPQLYKAIENLNNSTRVDKWIVKNGEVLSFATPEELVDGLKKLKKRALTYLTRYSRAKRKMRLNGQGKLLSNAGEIITPQSKAKAFVETYQK